MGTLRPDKKQNFGGNALKDFNRKKAEIDKPVSQADLIRKLAKKTTEKPSASPVIPPQTMQEKTPVRTPVRTPVQDEKYRSSYSSTDSSLTRVNAGVDTGVCTRVDTGVETPVRTPVSTPVKDSNFILLTNRQGQLFKILNQYKSGTTTGKHLSHATGIPYNTIIKYLRMLRDKGCIRFEKITKGQRGLFFEVITSDNVIFDEEKPGILTPVRTPVQTPVQTPASTPVFVSSEQISYKKERKILLKNLSFSDFWLDQGLTQQKLDVWMEEFSFTEEEWISQLMFGAHEPKMKNADSPIKYFYKSLKQGGLTRPDGFEFPEERQARIRQEEFEARKQLIEKEKKLREEERALAEEESFLALLKEKEIIDEAIKEFEKGHMTPKFKISIKTFRDKGHVDERLETRLKIWIRESNEYP